MSLRSRDPQERLGSSVHFSVSARCRQLQGPGACVFEDETRGEDARARLAKEPPPSPLFKLFEHASLHYSDNDDAADRPGRMGLRDHTEALGS